MLHLEDFEKMAREGGGYFDVTRKRYYFEGVIPAPGVIPTEPDIFVFTEDSSDGKVRFFFREDGKLCYSDGHLAIQIQAQGVPTFQSVVQSSGG